MVKPSLVIMVVLLALFTSSAYSFEKLSEAASAEAKKFAVIFDFDTDSCYPSPAVSKDGDMSGGLKATGDITGGCRSKEQLENSNTYYRKATIQKDGVAYSVHMYALYFMKDQWAPVNPFGFAGQAGHRHDWEFALVWTMNGEITHASYSAHGKVTTEAKDRLKFDDGKANNVKIVYHKDDIKTHSFRFAKADEKGDSSAENDLKRWFTPTLVDWRMMKGGSASNEDLRRKFNEHSFGEANCPFNDKNFPKELSKNPPRNYPVASEWKKVAEPN